MPKKPIRHYKFSDSTLAQFADQLKINVNRDMADFTPRGVSAVDLTAFQTLISGFNGIKTDEELAGLVSAATEEKDTTRRSLEVRLRTIRGIAEVTYEGKGLYKTFGFDGMTELSDSDLHRLALRVHRVATERQSDMQGNGLTELMLNDLQTTADEFNDRIDSVTTLSNNREIATQERVASGNTLFSKANGLATVGKNIYFDTNPAKYNDYVLPAHQGNGNSGNDNPSPPPQP